ncbi:hypothetical protein, partial [Corynebacterium cystitidis]|uniref:hypothetical protein n=1 Tax=Corynebacterium cystitidis TaxID=35757 RepID=UPI00211EB490
EYNPRTHPIKETNITPNQKETIPQTTTPTHQKNPDTNNQHPPKNQQHHATASQPSKKLDTAQ